MFNLGHAFKVADRFSKAAKLLGISARALNYKIQNLKITSPKWHKNKGEERKMNIII